MATDDRSRDLDIVPHRLSVVLMLGLALWILTGAAILGFVLWKNVPNWHSRVTAFEAYVVVAAAVSIWGCSRSWRIQLRTDNHGVTVRNFLRTHRIGWSEVSRFTDGSVKLFDEHHWTLGIVLRDGRVITDRRL
jgi:Bacterial PH domain